MWNDADLQRDVEKELAWDPSVHHKQIGVEVKNGAVELNGHVDTYLEKCAAGRAVWRVAHVKTLSNQIRVELPFQTVRADDDIALAAMGWLEWNCLALDAVEVQVTEAWVTLTGTVRWQYQKEAAEDALRPLKGIQGIHNEIKVQPEVVMGDVKGALEEALKRNALVDSSHIKAHASHGVVSLRGAARFRAEHEQALHAAWAAPGVTKVEDHITIGLTRGE